MRIVKVHNNRETGECTFEVPTKIALKVSLNEMTNSKTTLLELLEQHMANTEQQMFLAIKRYLLLGIVGEEAFMIHQDEPDLSVLEEINTKGALIGMVDTMERTTKYIDDETKQYR